EFTEIGNIIADRLLSPDSEIVTADCLRRVAALCDRFPLYPHIEIPVPVSVSR
ncbi:MAG: serine hydroxymethyltransferase, partial [Dolichospermum sp.]